MKKISNASLRRITCIFHTLSLIFPQAKYQTFDIRSLLNPSKTSTYPLILSSSAFCSGGASASSAVAGWPTSVISSFSSLFNYTKLIPSLPLQWLLLTFPLLLFSNSPPLLSFGSYSVLNSLVSTVAITSLRLHFPSIMSSPLELLQFPVPPHLALILPPIWGNGGKRLIPSRTPFPSLTRGFAATIARERPHPDL